MIGKLVSIGKMTLYVIYLGWINLWVSLKQDEYQIFMAQLSLQSHEQDN